MPESDGSIEINVVGAIRLALQAAANDEAALGLITWLVDCAPPTEEGNTACVKLLLDGIRTIGYSITPVVPSGAWMPA